MDRSYRNRLLREAAKHPERLVNSDRFWKLELWPHYLRRCDDILFEDPARGLALSKPAPELAAKIADVHPQASRPELMLLGYSYLGSALRRNDDYGRAEAAFEQARRYRNNVSPSVLAEHLRRFAYLRLFQRNPECFRIIDEAITIHKRGNLVHRHPLGESLICRARAFVMFGQHGNSFDDYTAALNHVSIKVDPKPYYCVLHCLAAWAVLYGSDEELRVAYENLKAALGLLNSTWGKTYAKLKLRWLIAVIEARLGADARAETVYLEVRDGLAKLGLGFEVGMISTDLALIYLSRRETWKMSTLLQETTELFRRIGVEGQAEATLEIWRCAKNVDRKLLQQVRERFMQHTSPIPSVAA